MKKYDKNIIHIMLLASGDMWAGAEVMLLHMVSGLVKIECLDFLVVLANAGRLASELDKLGVKVHIIDESRNSFIQSIGIVRKLFNDFKPDIIHSHRYKENLLAWIVSSGGMSNCTLVATQHGLPENLSTFSIKNQVRVGFFFRLQTIGFARSVAVSEEMQQVLIGRYGFSKKNLIVIRNGITIPKLVIRKSRVRLIFGSAGRLFPVKDFSLMVDVVRSVVSQNDTVDFVLAGDGPERTILEDKVRMYGLRDRFRFLGHQEDMASFYKRLDVYINTSVHEGIPMSVLEAMSYGLPVVVPKVGGLPEIVEEGVSGYLVDNRDPEIFARRILQLLDPERRQSIGSAARERVVASFSQEAMAQQYYRLYKELIDNA